MMGGYRLEPDGIAFGPVAGTMMACPEPLAKAETALTKALEGARSWRIIGPGLELFDAEAPDRPLRGGLPALRRASAHLAQPQPSQGGRVDLQPRTGRAEAEDPAEPAGAVDPVLLVGLVRLGAQALRQPVEGRLVMGVLQRPPFRAA